MRSYARGREGQPVDTWFAESPRHVRMCVGWKRGGIVAFMKTIGGVEQRLGSAEGGDNVRSDITGTVGGLQTHVHAGGALWCVAHAQP